MYENCKLRPEDFYISNWEGKESTDDISRHIDVEEDMIHHNLDGKKLSIHLYNWHNVISVFLKLVFRFQGSLALN